MAEPRQPPDRPSPQPRDDGRPPSRRQMTPKRGQPLHDPLLNQAKEQIEATVPEAHREAYERMVAAGQAVLYSPPTRKYLLEVFDALQQSQHDPMVAAHAGIKLLELLDRESKGQIRQEVGFLALQVLILYALDSYVRVQEAPVDKAFLARLMQLLAGGYLRFFGIDEQKMHQAVQEGAAQAQGRGGAQGGGAPAAPAGGEPPGRGLLAQPGGR